MKAVALLGSTGSIGRSTLDVLRRQQEHFRLVALTAGQNRDDLERQVAEWRPVYAGLAARPRTRAGRRVPRCWSRRRHTLKSTSS